MRTSPAVLAILAIGTATFLGGCRSGDGSSDGTGDSPANTSSDDASGGGDDAAAGGGDGGGATGAAGPGDDDSARSQMVQAQVDHYLAEARKQLENGDVDGATVSLRFALEADPSDARVLAMRDRIALQGGQRDATSGEIARSAAEAISANQQMVRAEVDNALLMARRMRENGDLDGAIRETERALMIFRWNPFIQNAQDEMGLTEASLRERVTGLREEKAAADRADAERRARVAAQEQQEREEAERRRQKNQIDTLLRRVNDAFYAKRYEEAIALSGSILYIDPNHAQAAELRDLAREAHAAALEGKYKSDFRYHWREIFDDLEYDDLPQTELMTFPERDAWQAIRDRGPQRFRVSNEAIPPEDAAVYDILENMMIAVTFDGTDFEPAIDYFRLNTGANIVVDPQVLDDAAATTLEYSMPPMPVGRALESLISFSGADARFVVTDGVVRIVPSDLPTGGQVLQFYDVRDITQGISSHPSRDFNLQPSSAFEDFDDDEDDPLPIVVDSDTLADLVRTNIHPDSWDNDVNNTINFVSGALVVQQTPEVHRDIHKLLSDLRANAGTLVNVETRFVEMEDRFLRDIGVDFRGLDGQNGSTSTATIPNVPMDDYGIPGTTDGVGAPGFPEGIGTGNDAGAFFTEGGDTDLRGRLENLYDLGLGDEDFQGTGGFFLEFTYLDDTQLEAILRAVEKSTMAQLVTAQNLTVYNGQRANFVVQDHISYLRDFEVEIAQGAVVADPVLGVLREGTILDVRPVASADRRFVTMEVRPTVSRLVEPIRLFRTSLAIGNEVELFLPEMEFQRVRTTVTIPDGSTLTLGGMKSITEKSFNSGIPFLSNIPVLGFLTSRRGTEHSREKLLILVRAKILIPEERELLAHR